MRLNTHLCTFRLPSLERAVSSSFLAAAAAAANNVTHRWFENCSRCFSVKLITANSPGFEIQKRCRARFVQAAVVPLGIAWFHLGISPSKTA